MPDNMDTDRNLNEEDVSIIMGPDTDTEEPGPSRGKRRRALSGRRLPDSENDEV